jgi:GTPase SAR1 family protein
VRLTFSSDAVVVVAGMPGAGKTTLIRRAVDPAVTRVVDTDDRPRRAPAPVLYAVHYARVLAAILGRRPAVIHSRGTHAGLREGWASIVVLDREQAARTCAIEFTAAAELRAAAANM